VIQLAVSFQTRRKLQRYYSLHTGPLLYEQIYCINICVEWNIFHFL